jgi:OFA family oxalate/formate antiporter-like MFS transporter
MLVAGRLQDRYGPRPVAFASGIVMALGYSVAARSGGAFPLLLLGNGVVCGVGIGLGYVCPLATCVKWFPRIKGLITGIAVAGFGGGAILLSQIAGLLFDRGYGVLDVFQWVGVAYGAAIALAALFLFLPPRRQTETQTLEKPPLRLFRDARYWALAAGMFGSTFGGLLVVGNLKPIGLSFGIAEGAATTAIAAFAVGNVVGRIAWGRIHDRFARPAVLTSILFLGATVLVLLVSGFAGPAFLAASILVGSGFGACFVVYAAQVAEDFGSDRVGVVYPWVFFPYGFAAIIGPFAGGLLFDWTGSYVPALVLSAVTATIAAGAFTLLSRKGARASDSA